MNMANFSEAKLQGELQLGDNFTELNNTEILPSYDCLDDESEKEIFKSKTCTYFLKFGHCKFGNNCKYLHEKRIEINKYNNNKSCQLSKFSKNHYENQHKNNENHLPSHLMQTANPQRFSKQICRYFKAGFCEKGDNCTFHHSFNVCRNETYLTSPNIFKQISKKDSAANSRTIKKSIPICHFFKTGLCHKGDKCKYYHQNKNTSSHSTINSSVVSIEKQNNSLLPNDCQNHESILEIYTINTPIKTSDVLSLTTEDISKLRTTEISQLRKRFPHHQIIAENRTFSFSFQPSDPDWPFDLKNLNVEVDFPKNYPTERCTIIVLQDAENIPQLLVKHLNKSTSEWIDQKFEQNTKNGKVELIFRPFLKWFDRNLEELFISGLRKVKQDLKAKEDGIEFVPVESLFPSPEKSNVDSPICEDFPELVSQSQAQDSYEKLLVEPDSNTKSFENSNNNGFKIIFSELELTEGAAALLCTKLSVTLHCSRCKTSFNMQTVSKRSNSHVCAKCSKNMGFVFDPSTVHQFSNILGNLYLLDCLAMDINLVECHFLVDCLNCSKQVPLDGIHYGQKHKMWCTFCHEKMIMTIGSVKFQTLKLESVPAVKYVPAKKIDKKVKDPIINEGEPLPNFGACKHYKKSYRWLRFPCCGRLYPCDECHDEKETDHEMKYASRMICGFCAKEQPYSREKPCLLCSQNLTKKSGSHWEGGKGCRNKIQMSRVDKQKYSGISKTVSRKAQSTKLKK